MLELHPPASYRGQWDDPINNPLVLPKLLQPERGWGGCIVANGYGYYVLCPLWVLDPVIVFRVYDLFNLASRLSCRFNYCHHDGEEEGVRTVRRQSTEGP